MSISGWSLLPIYRLRNRIFSTGALRAPPGKTPQHNTPPPHRTLAWRPCPHICQRCLPRTHHTSFSTASRSPATRRGCAGGSMPRLCASTSMRRERPRSSPPFTVVVLTVLQESSIATFTFTILRPKVANFYRYPERLTLCQDARGREERPWPTPSPTSYEQRTSSGLRAVRAASCERPRPGNPHYLCMHS
jgi:hypothetical protein